MRFKGWLPCGFVIAAPAPGTDFPQSAPMAVKIGFADGSSSVRSAAISSFPPGPMSPLLVYPSADAVSMELFYERCSLRVDLRPDPSGRFAYWLADDGLPGPEKIEPRAARIPSTGRPGSGHQSHRARFGSPGDSKRAEWFRNGGKHYSRRHRARTRRAGGKDKGRHVTLHLHRQSVVGKPVGKTP